MAEGGVNVSLRISHEDLVILYEKAHILGVRLRLSVLVAGDAVESPGLCLDLCRA
jgi:hypothetical protein